MDLTHKTLLKLLNYNPRTGHFINRVWRGGSAYAGKRTGRPNSDGYIQICVVGKRYMASRLAYFYMKGKWPPFEMDHKNLDNQDDRWINLRPANDSQNQMNRRPQKNNRFNCKGVGRCRDGKNWYAEISKENKRIGLGKFETKRAAITARHKAEKKLFGEFARR